MSQTVVTVDVGGTGANNANAALTNLGALPTFGGSISGNLNVASSLVVTGNANLGSYVISGNSISTTQNNGDVVLTPKGTGRLRVRSKILSGNGAEAHFSSSGIDESSIGIGSFNDSNGAAELLIVNKNSGTLAYSEMIAINDTGDQDQGWISVGVNSSGYDDPEYTLTGPDDGYVLFEAPQGTSANGDLIIGTGSFGLNNKIVMAAGGFTPTDAQLVIMPADLKRANLTSYVVASNVVTFTTDTTHTFVANDIVAISGVGAPYDGTRTVTANTINTFNVSVTTGNIGPINLSPAGFAIQFLPFNKGTVELTAQLFVGENSRSTIETADITLAEGHAIPLGIVVDNDGPGQTVMFNKSNGTLAFSEFIAHNDQGNVHQGWISMGINSSGYDDPEFPITKEDDGYLLFEAPAGTTGGGDLIIGTGTNGQTNRLIFAAEGFDEANAQMIITPDESVRISIATDASSANTGALQVVGGIGVQGSMYVQGNQTIQGDLIVNGSQVIQSIENLAAAGPISLLSDGNIANTWDQGIVGTYAVSKTSNTHSVTFKAIANNTGTLTTANNHGFVAEDYVTVANVDVTFNGTHRITAATSNTISFFLLANNLSITAATGTATVDKAARYTGVVKRATDGNWRFFSGLGTRPAFNTDFTDANLAFDSIIAGSADFRGSLKLGSPNTATIVYTDNNARTLTIPALAGNRTFAFINEAQTFTAAQAVSSTVTATKFIPTAGDATGNGLYLAGVNTLGFSADGVERLNMSASAMVVNDGSNDYDFRVESDGNANMLFVDGGLNRVGIGTGSPNATLEVNGNIYLTSNSNFLLFGTNSAINPYIQGDTGGQKLFLGVNNGSALTIDSSKNVGIGTTNPVRTLTVYAATDSHIILQNANYNGAINKGFNLVLSSSGDAQVWNYQNANLQFATNNTERMRITSSGAVLVGITSDPTGSTAQHFFSHSGDLATALVVGDATNTASISGIYIRSQDPRLVRPTNFPIHIADTSGTKHVTIMGTNSGGNVGIGTTSPSRKLDVIGDSNSGIRLKQNGQIAYALASNTFYTGLVFENQTTTHAWSMGYNQGATFSINWFDADTNTFSNRLLITSGGNVGIGTTSPANKLHVYGSIRAGIAGNSSANYPALEVTASGTADAQAAIAIQQTFTEGDTIIFADYEPYAEWGISTENDSNLIHFTSGDNTNSLGSKTIYNRTGNARTAYKKFEVNLGNGQTLIGGNLGVGTSSPGYKIELGSGLLKVFDGITNWSTSATKYYTHLCTNNSYNGTGAVVITTNIPGHNQSGNGNMFTFRITGYCYDSTNQGAIDMVVGCYAGENNFYNATVTGTIPTAWLGNINFYTNPSGKVALVLGTVSTFQVCMFAVTDFVQSFSNPSTSYAQGWSTTLVTSLTGYTNATAPLYRSTARYFDSNVGIGITSPSAKLHIYQTAGGIDHLKLDTNFGSGNAFALNPFITGVSNGGFSIRDVTNAVDRLVIQYATGHVGINTTSPGNKLDVWGDDGGNGGIRLVTKTSGTASYQTIALIRNTGSTVNDGWFQLYDNGTARINMAANASRGGDTYFNTGGKVGIGTTTPSYTFQVNKTAIATPAMMIGGGFYGGPRLQVYGLDADGAGWMGLGTDMSSGIYEHSIYYPDTGSNGRLSFGTYNGTTYTERMSLSRTGALNVTGALSKGSGSFKIDHPLPEKSNTHYLVHSFIEGPQADLIYSGKVQLQNGLASINIDAHSNMTEGTFVALCRDIRCFTNNESDWDNVRGKVIGNILTIECQNPLSTATISWMVIGERQDKHMFDTEWTDENGKVIVEPEKALIQETYEDNQAK